MRQFLYLILSLCVIGCVPKKRTEKDYTAEQYTGIKDRCIKVADLLSVKNRKLYFDWGEQNYMCEMVLRAKRNKNYLGLYTIDEKEVKAIIRYLDIVKATND